MTGDDLDAAIDQAMTGGGPVDTAPPR